MKINLKPGKVLPIVGGLLTLAGMVVSNKIDSENRNELKAELKNELLNEILKEKN